MPTGPGGRATSRQQEVGYVRRRVAAFIERDGLMLMVRQRGRSATGRHDGAEYLTLPGGGVEAQESDHDALVREVREEVGLTLRSSTFIAEIPHGDGLNISAIFSAVVDEGEAVLGYDPELTCDCPLLVGLSWEPAMDRSVWLGDGARTALVQAVPVVSGSSGGSERVPPSSAIRPDQEQAKGPHLSITPTLFLGTPPPYKTAVLVETAEEAVAVILDGKVAVLPEGSWAEAEVVVKAFASPQHAACKVASAQEQYLRWAQEGLEP